METPTDIQDGVIRGDSTGEDAPVSTHSIVSEYLRFNEPRRPSPGRKGPLTLLELPVDILQLVVKEITHTNDLTALALTNSALYNLAIPLIYSRFDIVWPDGQITATESKSVDALTYGLSTLCLGSAFARTTRRALQSNTRRLARFTGNDYAQYTKKFSLGNGPTDWVIEYMITKESGKMLGTLVAIAIAKMKNLETFTWDMPTGVLSDIFMALGSLAENKGDDYKLNRVWVRWHDNTGEAPLTAPPSVSTIASLAATVPAGSHLTAVGILIPDNASHPTPRAPVSYAGYPCEYPTFSVLPPLKSLTVLDIDEVSYLDEMAVLVERSKEGLQELRIGISPKGVMKDFAQTWDGASLKQIDHKARWPGGSSIGERRLGGVLGILVAKIYDIRQHRSSRGKRVATDATASDGSASSATQVSTGAQIGASSSLPSNSPPAMPPAPGSLQIQTADGIKTPRHGKTSKRLLDGKLKLQTLELERVILSLHVCRHAFDWRVLTHLTLLDCAQHENLWKMLRKQFQPTPINTGTGPSLSWKQAPANAPLQYHLALKSIHTDTTTLALINFIKETLAPNTLEVLFLQDCKRGSVPPVALSEIFKGALKRHPSSLRKLLLDSSATKNPPPPATGSNSENTRWKAWALSTEVVLYITSGRMVNLRELAVSLEYIDWHTFLQRLPNIPQLRSLNISQMAGYPNGNFEPRELAHQIADIITLRPEIRLCYTGIGSKCFEMLEYRGDELEPGSSSVPDLSAPLSGLSFFSSGTSGVGVNGGTTADHDDAEDTSGDEDDEDDDDDDDEDGEVDDDDDEDDDDDDNTPTTATSDPDETQSEGDAEAEEESPTDEDDDGFVEPGSGDMRLRLREILFYDDKVAIFKARHGKL